MKHAVVIIGGGPAGSAAAMFLNKHGIESTIVERMKFPRYHIGESMTGECGQSVRRLGLDVEMQRANYPIKRAASIYGNNSYRWSLPIAAQDENWNLQVGSTWQVRRAEFDKMLLDTAIARGANFINAEAVAPIVDDAGTVRGVTIRELSGKIFDIESEMLLDCSGQATFLANSGITGPKYSGNYDRQVAIFSHVANTIRDPEAPGDTLLF